MVPAVPDPEANIATTLSKPASKDTSTHGFSARRFSAAFATASLNSSSGKVLVQDASPSSSWVPALLVGLVLW